jgi:hypothetical protein
LILPGCCAFPTATARPPTRKSLPSCPHEEHGDPRSLYEVELDLSHIPILEPVSLELEFLVPPPVVNGRIDFETYAKTDLASL